MNIIYAAVIGCLIVPMTFGAIPGVPIVKTTSGTLHGSEEGGGEAIVAESGGGVPVDHFTNSSSCIIQGNLGDLRWEAPKPFISHATRNATALSPACVQQFVFATQALFEFIFNTPAPPESEDCLFLNVWAPAQRTSPKKSVVIWIHGGALATGTASIPAFDGTSFAKNQDIIIVTTNYRTNAFGFPGAEELFPNKENLGFLDQDLAFQWVQENIDAFGGDPKKVTIMGQSAGSESVAQAIQRHSQDTPFRAAIMQSGAALSMSSIPSFTTFDALAKAVNCTHSPGPSRIACLKAVPADTIRAWANGPEGLSFGPVVDNATVFTNPIQRIRERKTARVPILNGANQDDGSLFTLGQTSLTNFLNGIAGDSVTVDEVRNAYPGLNDTQIISNVFRDLVFLCPAELTTSAFVQSGEVNVFRYMYGAVFADLQLFPGAGAWHSSEVGEIFGNFNATTATPSEKTLSHTMQTVWTNFIKDPTSPPAPNWERFIPGNRTDRLAKLAYQGNVQLGDVVQPAPGGLDDGPCNTIWDAMLDF